jgi:predicted carbohydrate-binding protein with CBM5 and CBM33 domain
MLASRELKVALVVALLATVLVMVGGEDRASAHGTCRHVDVGHTEAGVTAKNLSCRKARAIVRGALREWSCDEDGCETMHVAGFKCTVGGPEGVVVLKCRRGSRRVRAVWGD